MATKNKVNITSDIVAEIRTGNSDTTAQGLRTILYEILDSYVNVKDGGLVYETPVGYNGLLTLTDAKSFVYKKWVEDYVSASVGLGAVLASDNKTNEQTILSNDGDSKAGIYNGEVFLEYSPPGFGVLFNGIRASSNKTQLYYIDGFMQEGQVLINTLGTSLWHTTEVSFYTPTIKINSTVENIFNSPLNKFIDGGVEFVSGIGIDTTATAGTDVLNIGATNANVINYGNASTIHNFLGTAIYELQVNSYVTDKLITLNYGGVIASGIGVGFEIEEAGSITGYFKTNASRDGFSMQTPAIVHTAHVLLNSFTADRTFNFPDASGTIAIESFVTSGYVPYSGATQDTDLGNYSLNGKSLHVKGTAGSGHLGLKHQSSNITAAASESSFGANSDGDAIWKNDGNAIQKINVFKRTTFGNANYTALKSDDLVCTSVTFTASRTVTLPSDSLQAHEITIADEFQTVTSTNTLVIGVASGKYLNGVLNGTETIQSAGGWRRFKTDGAGNWSFDTGIVRRTATQTLTNKTIQKRILVVTQSATPATNIDNGDIVSITGLAQAITSMTSGLSGTPYGGQMIMWQITDNGTGRAITWGASFASTTNFTLPTTTVASTMLRVLTQWNSVTSKHECIG